tara:strand:- start:37 stop:219 length:183 start_codon:yes stop_codon:yes gene_type:complete
MNLIHVKLLHELNICPTLNEIFLKRHFSPTSIGGKIYRNLKTLLLQMALSIHKNTNYYIV